MFARLLLLLTIVVGLVGFLRPPTAFADERSPEGVSLCGHTHADRDADTGGEATLPSPGPPIYVPAGHELLGAPPLPSYGRRHAARLFRPPRSVTLT